MSHDDETKTLPPEGEPPRSGDGKTQAALKALGPNDKLVLFGSVALVVLFLLPWYSVSANIMGLKQSSSTNGLHELSWLGWIAAIAAAVLALTRAGILGAMPPAVRTASGNAGLMVVLTGLALLAGPLYFWGQVGGGPGEGIEQLAQVSMGKTFFFWLALLAAIAAVVGAVRRLLADRPQGA